LRVRAKPRRKTTLSRTAFENAHQVVARNAAACLSEIVVSAELVLEDAIDELCLLLLSKLLAILALLAPTLLWLAVRFLVDAHNHRVDAELAGTS